MKKFILLFIVSVLSAGAGSAQFSWTQKDDAPDNRYEGVSFSAGGKVYYGLGHNSTQGIADNKFYVFDPQTNSWDTIAAFPGTPRRMASAFSIDSKGYLGFGVDPLTTLQLSDLWEYDPSQNLWTQKTGLPAASGWLAGTATATGTKGYAGLGLHDHSTGTLNLNWWEYDPSADTWSQKTDIPGFGLYQPASFTIGDSIYVICGIGSALLIPTREVWLFDIQANTWTQQPDFPGSSRSLVSAFTINGTGYAGYGMGTGATDLFNDFYSFNSTTGIWTPEPYCATALFDAACATSTAGYVINNTSWNSSSPDVWEFANSTTSVKPAGGAQINFSAHPNPSNGIISISSDHFGKVTIHSMEGKEIQAFEIIPSVETTLDISGLANGMYYLIAANAEEVSRIKVCIAK